VVGIAAHRRGCPLSTAVRNTFAAELLALAAQDARIVLLSGDIGNRLFDGFKGRFPDRFFNCGVAEANMMGVAAGMAMSGLRPVVYTIAAFATMRCLEQIRVDVCYPRQPVVIAGVGAGLSYASLGGTHHACEDIGVLRLLPAMSVVCPGDPFEVRAALRAALAHDGPVYLRLGKKGEPAVHRTAPDFSIGRSIQLRRGRDIALLGVGTMLPLAVAVAEALQGQGLSVDLESLHTVKPLDEPCLARLFDQCTVVATLEEHSVRGGAGSAIAEWRAHHPEAKAHLLVMGTADEFLHHAGSQAYARERFGLTPEAVVPQVLAAYHTAARRR
jgi:transketolase